MGELETGLENIRYPAFAFIQIYDWAELLHIHTAKGFIGNGVLGCILAEYIDLGKGAAQYSRGKSGC